VAGRLRLDLAQYREMAAFAQFGSDLDKATQAQLTRGERMVEVLKQNQYVPMPLEQQVMAIYAGGQGFLDDLPVADIRRFEAEFLKYMAERYPDVGLEIKNSHDLAPAVEAKLKTAVQEFKARFAAPPAAPAAGR